MKRSGSKPRDLGFEKWSKKWSKNIFSQKCPKSISLDSGHLDKPFGPLIFQFFQYFLNFFGDRFFGLFFRFGDPLDPLTCISLGEGDMYFQSYTSMLMDGSIYVCLALSRYRMTLAVGKHVGCSNFLLLCPAYSHITVFTQWNSQIFF